MRSPASSTGTRLWRVVSAASRDQIVGFLAVGTPASIWGTLGLFAKSLYAAGVSFEALVAARASLGWTAMLLFVLLRRGVGSLRVARGISFSSSLWGFWGSGPSI